MTRITVLTGGSTPEREVALAGAAQVVSALRAVGYHVTVIDTVNGSLSPSDEERLLVPSVGRVPPSLEELRVLAARESLSALVALPAVREADLVFIVLHGRQGEGGLVQAILETACIPYAGSDPTGSALAMDKDVAKRLLRHAGVPTPNWVMWPAEDEEIRRLGRPLVVKPSKAGSTVGLTVVRDSSHVRAAVDLALAYDDEVMVEEFLDGREFTVGVLGDEALTVGEIIPQHEIFDYECKYTPGMTQEIFPADLPSGEAARFRALALRAHRTLKLRDFSRVDFRLENTGVPNCLELNTLPGLTATSLLPQSAAAMGIDFRELCDRICQLALRRTRSRNKVQA
jgi:D-alanine-D-alanine ligase